MKNRIWMLGAVICLAVCLAAGCVCGAMAEEQTVTAAAEMTSAEADFRVSGKNAEEGYVDLLFGIEPPRLRGTVAGDRFEKGSPERILYEALKRCVQQVAAGELTSTEFTFEGDEFAAREYTAASLGVSSLYSNGNVSAEAEAKIGEELLALIDPVVSAVMYDCPYDGYWRGLQYFRGWGYSITTQNGTAIKLEVPYITISMTVASDYQDTNAADPEFAVHGGQMERAPL